LSPERISKDNGRIQVGRDLGDLKIMKHHAGHNSVVITSEKDDYLSEKD